MAFLNLCLYDAAEQYPATQKNTANHEQDIFFAKLSSNNFLEIIKSNQIKVNQRRSTVFEKQKKLLTTGEYPGISPKGEIM